jgi:hypothetical protein
MSGSGGRLEGTGEPIGEVVRLVRGEYHVELT